jgi:hypothetical protein
LTDRSVWTRFGGVKIDSIVIAVNDIARATDEFERYFDLTFDRRYSIPEHQIETRLAEFGATSLQLISPTSADGLIATFLRERGEGVSGVTVAVDDVAEARERFVATGLARPDAEIVDAGYARELLLRPSRTHGALFVLREWRA